MEVGQGTVAAAGGVGEGGVAGLVGTRRRYAAPSFHDEGSD